MIAELLSEEAILRLLPLLDREMAAMMKDARSGKIIDYSEQPEVVDRLAAIGCMERTDRDDGSKRWVVNHNGTRALKHWEAMQPKASSPCQVDEARFVPPH